MIEQFLQTALEFFKEIWFQLNSQFDLENTEAFKLLKPYLIQLQDNPLYMGISLAALFLVPYTLIKVRSVSKQREQKLDELMEEMEEEEDEEEYDEDDPRRLRRPEPEMDDDDGEKPLFGNEEVTASSEMEDLDEEETVITEEDLEADFETELDEFELEPSEPLSDNQDNIDIETKAEPVSSLLTESEFDKDLNDFMAEELDWNPEDKDKTSELGLEDASHDQAIKELQEEGELMDLEENLPVNDPFSNYSELDEDEQDKAIKDLQDEMERTINQLTQQIEEPSEVPSSIKDLSQIHIGGDATIDEGYTAEEDEKEEFYLEDSEEKTPAHDIAEIHTDDPPITEASASTPISELTDEEILASLEPELETKEPETTFDSIPDTRDYESDEIPGFTFEPESDILQNEPDIKQEVPSFTFEPEPIGPEETPELDSRNSSISNKPEGGYSSPEQTDNLIDRLKFLQTRFENRYQPPPMSAPVEKKDYGTESLAEPRAYTKAPASVPPDSKKYMDLLESFIFMKDQKKHK
jgi:hypothetical protein